MTSEEHPHTLRTLGDLHLGTFRKVKSLLMLAYVALEGPTPRLDLRALLWPHARVPESSLRVALYVLREYAAGTLEGEERVETGVPCDAAALLTLRGQAALDAYPGAFLQGVKLGDVSTEFEEWAEGWRTRLARHVQNEALTLAETSDPTHAEALAGRAYRLPGAPPAEPELLRRLLALTLPGSPLETELRAELLDLTGPEDTPVRPATRSGRMLGRAEPLDALLAWAARPGGAIAAVSGPGGIGKSTLSRELLRELNQQGRSAVLVDAEGARTGGELLPRLAAARAPGQAVQGTWAGLGALLGESPVVLLDGVDDLDDLGELLGTLRRDLPDVRWVLTGRRRRLGQLSVSRGSGTPTPDDTLTLSLTGLDVPPPDADLAEIAASSAVALFLREAARVRRDFALTSGNAGVIGGLTRRLLGHPLALALAASWLRVESLDDVYARVLAEAATLSSPGGDHDGRRGLMLVAQRSWDLLDGREQVAALRLGVCADFDPADAPALGVSDTELDSLLAHSFLETYQPGSERLRVYPALTGVLEQQARAQPELAHAARVTHAQHYLTWFQAQAPESPPVDAERANLRVAVSSAILEGSLKASTVDHLLAHYDRRGLLGSGTDAFAVLADEAEDARAPDDIQAAAQIACMWLAYRSGRLLDAQTLAARFLQGPLAGDPASRMKVLNTLGSVRGQQGQYQSSIDLLRQALTLAEQLGDRMRMVGYRMNIVTHMSYLGNVEAIAKELDELETSLPAYPREWGANIRRMILGVRVTIPGLNLHNLYSEAAELVEDGERKGDISLALQSMVDLTTISLRLGNLRQAQTVIGRIRETSRNADVIEVETSLALLETELLYARGRTPEARRAARTALQVMAKRGNPWELVALFLIVADDFLTTDSEAVRSFLASISDNADIHFDQRRKAREKLRSIPTRTESLNLTTLRSWLQHRLSV